MLNIMSATIIRKASIRELQHNFAKLLYWIERGEEIIITKHHKPVAAIKPLEKKIQKIQRPDFQKRLKATFAHPIEDISNAELISEMREDRF